MLGNGQDNYNKEEYLQKTSLIRYLNLKKINRIKNNINIRIQNQRVKQSEKQIDSSVHN